MFLNQIMHMPKPQLNTFNFSAPGESSPDATFGTRFLGQVGRFVYAQSGSPQLKFDPSVGTLYGGIYQLVKVVATPAVAIVTGMVAYWSDPFTFTVNTDADALGFAPAGIFLNPVTGGNYTFIQVAGIALVSFLANVTAETGIGSTVTTAAGSLADVLADATSITNLNSKQIIGRALSAVVDATAPNLNPVLLNLHGFVF